MKGEMMKGKEEVEEFEKTEEETSAHDPWQRPHDSRRGGGWCVVRGEQLLSWESHQVHESPADGASTQASSTPRPVPAREYFSPWCSFASK